VVAFFIRAFGSNGNAITFRQPVVQVDHFAALAAKGAEGLIRPENFLVTGWTSHGHDLQGDRHRRLDLDEP
jgi:hypothetical protein